MDYKKKYEEALENIKKIKSANKDNKELVDFIEYEYPELKESEDERISKEIISYITDHKNWFPKEETKNSWIAWLEKQGEQKSVDKVEPKFKVGDWIINSEGMLRHILAVDKTGYQTDYGWLTHDIYDNTYHLWTIQDARKGDILQANKCTLIFDSLTNDIDGDTVISSWYYCDTKTFYGMGTCDPDLWAIEGVTPATQEQRDLLFTKMKEAGYEWDVEKKELKDIKEQNPAWSEDDEKGLGDALYAIQQARTIAKDENDMGNLWYAENWLKSLKERMKGE